MNHKVTSFEDKLQGFVLEMKNKTTEEIQRNAESFVFELQQFVPKRFWAEIWKLVVIRAFKTEYDRKQIAALCSGMKGFVFGMVPEEQFNFVVDNISKGYLYDSKNFSDYVRIVLKIKKLSFKELDKGIISGE